MLVLLALFPHLIGSIVNILYNEEIIVTKDPAQQASFHRLVLAYNCVVYPLVVMAGIAVISASLARLESVAHAGRSCGGGGGPHPRQTLALPGGIVVLSCLGWFPGGVLFPLGMHLEPGPWRSGDFIHFLLSFVISGLIATTYAYFAAQFVVLRVLYPQMWSDPSGRTCTCKLELRGCPPSRWRFQFVAVLIPLIGAAL